MKNLSTKLSTIELSNGVIQTVVEKTGRQVEQEVTLDRSLNRGRIEFIDKDAIDNRLPYLVVVPGPPLDVFWGRAECLAAKTGGNVPFADDTILLSSWWVFFSIHAWFLLFVSSENPSRGNQVFSCLYQC